MSGTPRALLTLMYEGWQVWDGDFGELGVVRAGGEVVASIEFVQRSEVRRVAPESALRLEHLEANRYRAVARVLDTEDAVVLDLGGARALRRVRRDEGPGDFTTGETVSVEVTLGFNGWPDAPWTRKAADAHGTDHRWLVHRITRFSSDHDGAEEIDEASTDTVDSAGEYCLLECSLVVDPGR